MFGLFVCGLNTPVTRCTAPADDLIAEAGHRSHVHTNALVGHYDLKVLWEDYGMAGRVTVSGISSFVGKLS
jgi:hypothetical protein